MSKTSDLFNNTPLDLSFSKIQTEDEYNAACSRIDELIPLCCQDGVPEDDPNTVELIRLGNLVADWEDENVIFD